MAACTCAPTREQRRRSPRVGLVLAVAALLAACSSSAGDDADAPTTTAATTVAPTSGGPDDGSATTTTGPSGSTTGPATLDPVVVAVLYPDVSVAAQLGLAEEVGDYVPVFEAVMDDANASGGIAGHEIRLEMVQFDLLVEGDPVRACLTATQDLDAFVVLGLGGVFGDPVTCVSDQNETLLIMSDGAPEEFYERAEGRLFSLTPAKGEAQVAIVDAFAEQLAAAPFAVFSVLDTGGDHEAVEASLLPALAAAGLDPAVTVVLDSDADVAASQIPIEVEELRARGVETVISTAGFFSTAPFATALESAGLDTTWIGSDAAGFASDLYASQIVPEQLDGARAVTVRTLGWEGAGLEEPAARAACRQRVGDLTGTEIAVDSIDVGSATEACNHADLLMAAGRLVEGDLTPDSLAAAIHRVTDIELADYGPAGFGDDDVTAANAVREITWSADCTCWSAIGDFEPVSGG